MNKEPINSLLTTTLYNSLFKNGVPKIGTTVSFSSIDNLVYYGSCATENMAQQHIEKLLKYTSVTRAYMLIVGNSGFLNYYIVYLRNKT